MVYIDVRDRKFQMMVVLPIVLAAAILGFAAVDGGTEPELVGVLLGIVAVLAFVVFIVVTFVQEKLAERQAAEAEADTDE